MALEKFVELLSSDEPKKCTAVVGDTSSDKPELCGDPARGRGKINGREIKFCKSHTPSDAISAGGRIKPVEFYIRETDETIEVE